MRPKSNMELNHKFIQLIKETDDPIRKQAIYDSAYAYAVIAGRDFVKFQPIYFMSNIENQSGFKPMVSYGWNKGGDDV